MSCSWGLSLRLAAIFPRFSTRLSARSMCSGCVVSSGIRLPWPTGGAATPLVVWVLPPGAVESPELAVTVVPSALAVLVRISEEVPADGVRPWVVAVSSGGRGPLELAVEDVVLSGVPTMSVFPSGRGRARVARAASSAFAVVGWSFPPRFSMPAC